MEATFADKNVIANQKFLRTGPIKIGVFEKKMWWRRQDLNLRTLARTDLQSVAIDHSATPPN